MSTTGTPLAEVPILGWNRMGARGSEITWARATAPNSRSPSRTLTRGSLAMFFTHWASWKCSAST